KSATCCAMATATFTCASPVEAPRCGVQITCSIPRSGWPAGGGSFSSTSRAAPATWPLLMAAASAASSTMPPRAQLTMRTPRRMRAVVPGPMSPRVSGVLGGGHVGAAGRVHDHDALLGGSVDVDVVDPDARPADHAERVRPREHVGGDLGAAADDEGVEAAHRVPQLRRRETGARLDLEL